MVLLGLRRILRVSGVKNTIMRIARGARVHGLWRSSGLSLRAPGYWSVVTGSGVSIGPVCCPCVAGAVGGVYHHVSLVLNLVMGRSFKTVAVPVNA